MTLRVRPDALRETALALESAGAQIATNPAGPELSAAASGLSNLAVGSACANVGTKLTAQARILGNNNDNFAENLRLAALRYENTDGESADKITLDNPEDLQDPFAGDPDGSIGAYERALQEAGLLEGSAPQGYYKQWLENAARNGVPPEDIVEIARRNNITPQSFDVLNGMEEVKDGTGADAKSFFLIPPGTKAEDLKKAAVMTYILNAGTGYDASQTSGVGNDFAETPYSADEVQRIIDRQSANSWSYSAAEQAAARGGALATTPNGMLMGMVPTQVDALSMQGGTTYGDLFTVNADKVADPTAQLKQIIGSGHSWGPVNGQLAEYNQDLDRVLHHEERHSQQWAQRGPLGMGRDYIVLGNIIDATTGVNPLEADAGLSDGGYA